MSYHKQIETKNKANKAFSLAKKSSCFFSNMVRFTPVKNIEIDIVFNDQMG